MCITTVCAGSSVPRVWKCLDDILHYHLYLLPFTSIKLYFILLPGALSILPRDCPIAIQDCNPSGQQKTQWQLYTSTLLDSSDMDALTPERSEEPQPTRFTHRGWCVRW